MKPQEFGERLDKVWEAVTRGSYSYEVWKKLRYHEQGSVTWPLQEQSALLTKYNGFFVPVSLALGHETFLEFAKVFDGHPKTASLPNLLREARQDTANLVPRVTQGDVEAECRKLKQYSRILDILKQMRNQQIAHIDSDPEPLDPILINEFESLMKGVRSVLGFLSSAHRGQALAWQLWEGEEHTKRVLGILLDDMKGMAT